MLAKLADGPEIVFGLVGPVGTALDEVASDIKTTIEDLGYTTSPEPISLIETLEPFQRFNKVFELKAKGRAYHAKMTVGNRFRTILDRGDALALMAIAEIRKQRKDVCGSERTPAPSRAYILSSLKRKEEVETLRRVYGDSFHLIAAYAPENARHTFLKNKIAKSTGEDPRQMAALAMELISRDEKERGKWKFGQNVSDTFPLADLFVDVTRREAARTAIQRFLRLLFGYQFHTPTRDEFGMFQAFGARYRSADLARQVGACICASDGQVLAVGTNDAPSPAGGLYWEETPPKESEQAPLTEDGRDFKKGDADPSNELRRMILLDTLDIMKTNDCLLPERAKDLNATADYLLPLLKDARLMAITEYGRSVHAEMAALTDAARRGIAVGGGVLYTTTFPCHNCAKHIVASGIKRLVYIEPYPKSKVADLYEDSVVLDKSDGGKVVFKSFVGIAPRRYELFAMTRRKVDETGKILKWREDPETMKVRLFR